MKVLFWNPFWAAHGDLLFYKNCIEKHLIPQANLLNSAGCSIDFVFPENLYDSSNLLSDDINCIEISTSDQFSMLNGFFDPSKILYKEEDDVLIKSISDFLVKKLDVFYDVIFLWETPVPFLERIFQNSLIIHQMPGAFSRAPYPQTVVFDPIGLYKKGSLYLNAKDIKNTEQGYFGSDLLSDFSNLSKKSINSFQPFNYNSFNFDGNYEKLVLLPLQVSSHYAFQADTNYTGQVDFLLDVLSKYNEKTGVIVTQYVSRLIQDSVLNKDVLAVLLKKWPNIIFKDDFNKINSISQYLIPVVDEVVTCSSSIGLQSMIWNKKLTVLNDTFLSPFASNVGNFGGESEYEKNNTLSFILSKNQPLASLVLNDKKFLLGIVEEMIARKKSGKKGLDLLPSFHMIDEKYHEKLINSFQIEKISKNTERFNTLWASRQNEVNKYVRLVNSPEVKAITFDVFDTLIKRSLEVPADIYKFLEPLAIKASNGITEDFARVRLNAEVQTRENSINGEITFDEIYLAIKNHYDIDEEILSELKRIEIEVELSFIKARDFGLSLWKAALETGKPIYLVSDMYLCSNAVGAMLSKAGYKGYKKLFLSSDYGVRKKEGGLFDVVLKEINVPSVNILHTGDNKVADIEQAELRGIRTFRLLRAIDRLRSNRIYKDIYSPRNGAGEKARSVVAGLTAHKLFDSPSGPSEKDSLFQGDPHNLGYAALGPMLTGFALWLGRQAKRDNISRLYFLSREGWLLKQVYDALHKSSDDVSSVYLYASRRATRVACLRNVGDILALASQPFRSGVTVGNLIFSRFGVQQKNIDINSLNQAGFSSVDQKLSSDSIGRQNFSLLCRLLADEILLNSEKERKCYLEYLQEKAVFSEIKPAVVDIGWKANMQGALGALLNKPLHGYYYATLQGAETWSQIGHKIFAYSGEMTSSSSLNSVIQNRHILEYLTCHIEPSLICIKKEGDKLVPKFRKEDSLGYRRSLIDDVHRGVINFAKDLHNECKDFLNLIWIDPHLGEKVFSHFVESPCSVDAALLKGHAFEDALGGVDKQYVIKGEQANAERDSVWKKGASCLYSQEVNKSNRPIESVILDKNELNKVSFSENKIKKSESFLVKKIETFAIRKLTSPRKFNKYLRDRHAFFIDSNMVLGKIWYRFFG